jgi:hypothetical protein
MAFALKKVEVATGNVTTQGWPRRSPAYSANVLKSEPKEAHGPHYIAAPMRSHQHRRIFRIKSGFIPFLRRSSRRTISASCRPSSRRRHPVRELTSRWWLTGGYMPLQWYQRPIYPRRGCGERSCCSGGVYCGDGDAPLWTTRAQDTRGAGRLIGRRRTPSPPSLARGSSAGRSSQGRVTGGAACAAGRARAGARAKAEFSYSPSAHWKWCEAVQAAAIWRRRRLFQRSGDFCRRILRQTDL